MLCEIALKDLVTDYDWLAVFGEGDNRNYNCTIPDVTSLDNTSTDVCPINDVVEVIAAVNGNNDGPDWVGVFRMKDGRFLAATGGCDYTGWD